MDAAREDRIERLFEEASALPPEGRAAFLDRACGTDTDLRAVVRALVAQAAHAHDFVDRVARPAVAGAMGELMGDSRSAEPRAPDPLVGQQVEHFRILEKLGGGGMGRVYKALDLRLDRTVALKFLPPHLGADEEAKQRFIVEAKTASGLDHPKICAIYEIGETDARQLFIAMAHYEGETLKAKIARGPLPVSEALDYVAQIAEGLERAHTSGIVHRDIKPANVMVTTQRDVKILDFGLAKIAGSDLTRESATIGTVAYMSPEQTRGSHVDARTDIWSLGVVLYEMLTGARPFRSQTDETLIHAIRHDAPKPVRDLRPEVRANVVRLVSCCLEKTPNSRYQSASELLAAVRAVQAGGTAARRRPAWRKRVYPYVGVAIPLGLLALFASMRLVPPETRINSLAVLPARPATQGAADQDLADGVTALLISELSKLSGLHRVSSRGSVLQYSGTQKSSRQVGRELGVDALVEMSLLRDGERVRMTANLIEVDGQGVLWSESFDRSLGDMLALQRELAGAIGRELQLRLTPQETLRLSAAAPRVDPEAWELFLRAIRVSGQNPGEFQRLLEQATEKDSAFALAYAKLALRYVILGRDRAKAERTIAKAAALDPSLPEIYLARGLLLSWMDFDWSGAEAEFRRAIELSPHENEPHHELSQLLMRVGRCDEAVAPEKRAIFGDPARRLFQSGLAEIYLYCRRYDDAIREFEKTLDVSSDSSNTYVGLGNAYFYQQQYTKALAMYEKAGAVPGWARVPLGSRKEALQEIGELKSALPRDDQNIFLRWDLARLYTSLGERDSAITWLERAYEHRDGMVVYLRVMPHFDPLRDDPRFQALLKKVRLTG